MAKKNKKGRVRLVRDDSSSSSDRLSNLPDSVLHRIFSFIDTASAVRTSVLSRQWRHVWKRLPTLYFSSYALENPWDSHFATLVDKVLSLRDHSKDVDQIIFLGYEDDCDIDLYHRVIQYAVSHRAQLLQFNLPKCGVEFSRLFGSVSCHHLKTLRLGWMDFLDPGSARFSTLTTLQLSGCSLQFEDERLDCSLSFPCLTNLDICQCWSTWIKVYAPQLLTLKLYGDYDLCIKIIAPNLKFLHLELWVSGDGRGGPDFSLPYVDRAEILVKEYINRVEENFDSDLNPLFRRLRNVRCLMLRSRTSQALKKIRKFLEQKPVCLAKLESLICVSDDAPNEVVNYQVEGCPNQEPKAKIHQKKRQKKRQS